MINDTRRKERADKSPRIFNLQILAVIIAAGVVPSLLMVLVYARTIDIPYWDELSYAPLVISAASGNLLWAAAWAQHNEHRTFFLALSMIGLSRLGGWSEICETIFGVGIISAYLAIFWNILILTLPSRLAPFAFLCTSLLVFSLAQYENLFWGAGLEWFLTNGAALFAIQRLSRSRLTSLDVVLAFLACVVASFTNAGGLITLPVGVILLALQAPIRWLVIAGWLGGIALTLSAFFYGYGSAPTFPIRLDQIVTVYPQYVFAYLGSPLGYWQGPELSMCLGIFSILVVASALLHFVRGRPSREQARSYVPWIALSAFVVGNAFLTGYGRAGAGVGQALSSRYITISTDLWVSVIALTILVVEEVLRKGLVRPRSVTLCGGVAFTVLIVLFTKSQIAGFSGMVTFTDSIAFAVRSILASPNPSDGDLILLSPGPAFLRIQFQHLAAVKQSALGRGVCESASRNNCWITR